MAMVLLGVAVGRTSTALDTWFLRFGNSPVRWLWHLMEPRVIAAGLVACVAVAAMRRRWLLAAMAVLAPAAGIALVGILKPLFGRDLRGGLMYPSGHTTVSVILLGIGVLLARAARWALVVAAAWCLLGMIGLGVHYHYFTDTVGGALLGTAVVCVAALVLRHTPRRT